MRKYEYIKDLEGKLKVIGEVRDKDSNLKVSELYAEHLKELREAINLLYEYMED